MVTVYADVLISVNILITYVFIVCVRVIFSAPTNKFMVALASFIGGVSSVVIFFEEGSVLLNILYKLLVCGVITAVAFMPDNVKRFFKLFGSFFGVSVFFGGAVYLINITLKPQNLLFNNGAVYFDMSVAYLIGVVFSVYGVFTLFEWLFLRHSVKNDSYDVIITFRQSEVTLRGFTDTGNSLRDGLSGNPVFVAGQKQVSTLFTYDETTFLKGGCTGTPPESLKQYYRILPCATATGKSLLPAFVPQRVVIMKDGKKADAGKVTIGISPEINDVEYGILLNKSIYDLDWKGSVNDESIFEKIIRTKK